MDEGVIADLKQFIAGAITQQTWDIRHDIQQLGKRMDGVETKLGGLETRMGGLENRMDGLENRMGGLEDRMGGLETRMSNLETRTGNLEMKVDDGFSGIAEILEDMNTHNSIVEQQVKDHSQRIMRLEKSPA